MAAQENGQGEGGALVPTRVPWSIPDALALLVTFIAAQLALLYLWGLVRAPEPESPPLIAIGIGSHLLLLALSLALVLLRTGRGQAVPGLLGFRPPRGQWIRPAVKAVVAGAVAVVGIRMAVTAALELFGIDWRQLPAQEISEVVRRAEGAGMVTAAALLAVVIAPVAEETFFRSVFYLPLRERLGPVGAALLVAALFSAAHGYLLGAGQLFLLSLVFSALFECSGSLWAPIAAHAAFNGVGFLLLRLVPFG